MARTKLKKNGVNLSRVTDKMCKFVLAYLVHGNAAKAAREAGYSIQTSAVQGAKLMKNDRVLALIGKLRREQGERFVIEADEVLEHLVACVIRDGKDFVDDDGIIVSNLNLLPETVTRAIDGIKQTTKQYRDNVTGQIVEETTTEIKLVSKASALRMAMEHKGLFASIKFEAQIAVLNLDAYNVTDNYKDPIEAQLLEAKSNDKPKRKK